MTTRLARVFPRKTTASPRDDLSFFGPPGLIIPDVDEVHISVVFTEDIPAAEKLYDCWSKIAPTKIGGPAFDDPGGDFVPGKYLKMGYVITSRGCPGGCEFCTVPRREGKLRELAITDGFNLVDNNILACSREHIGKVFAMLLRQKSPVKLTGGLDSRRLDDWAVAQLWALRPSCMYFAYDSADDLEPLVEAGKKMRYANFTRHHLCCYVLIGQDGDTIEAAEKRLRKAWVAGFTPMAMLWSPYHSGEVMHDNEWRSLQRRWARPAIFKAILKDEYVAKYCPPPPRTARLLGNSEAGQIVR